jgi:nucleotide-binding universal stress UspA family protein
MKPVMLATDGSPTAEAATATAIELAQLLDTDLVVATVWDIPYTTVGLAPAPISGDLAKLSEEQARKIAVEAAARAEEAGVETRTLVLRGLPVEQICLAADKYEPRLLVIGSHGWGALRRRCSARSRPACSITPSGRCSWFAPRRPASRQPRTGRLSTHTHELPPGV